MVNPFTLGNFLNFCVMDKSLYFLYSMVQATDNDPCWVEPEKEIRSESDLQKVLDSIFTVDEKSGLPRTDVQYYLSGNGNPQVREWLINNLMKPRADKLRSSVDGVTDDMMFEFSRKPGEEFDDYRQRIYNLGAEAKAFYEANKPKVE